MQNDYNSRNQFIENYATSCENERIIYYRKQCSQQFIEILDFKKMFFDDLKKSINNNRALQFNFLPNRNRLIDFKSMFFFLHKEVAQVVWEVENNQCADTCPICKHDYSTEEGLPSSLVYSGNFTFDTTERIQHLHSYSAICRKCHYTKNINLIEKEQDKKVFDLLIQHYADVNNITIETALNEYSNALVECENLHKKEVYKLDFSAMKTQFDFANYPQSVDDEDFSMFLIEYIDDDLQYLNRIE